MEGGNRFQMPSPVSSSGERFPVVRTGVPPLQGSTLTGSNAGSCDREAAFCSKRSGNAEFICLRLLFPERDKDEGFFCCSDRKTNSGCPIFTAPEEILSPCWKTPGRSPMHCHVEHPNEREELISWTHLQSFWSQPYALHFGSSANFSKLQKTTLNMRIYTGLHRLVHVQILYFAEEP